MRDRAISNNERQFVEHCIAAEHRVDGRKPAETRQVSITLGPSWGFAEVHLDDTFAVASTTVEPILPTPDRPSEGTITIHIDQSATSSETAARDVLHRTSGLQNFQETRAAVESFVRDSRALDTEALCILSGVKVWAVRVAVDLLNDDGNATDAAMLAVMASLLHARRPDVTVSGRDVRVHSMDEREPVALPVHHVPLSVTFALFGAIGPHGGRDAAVVDPTALEEAASAGSASFALNAQGEVCGVHKAGGLPLLPASFAWCAALAAKRVVELTAIVKHALANAAADHPLSTSRPLVVAADPAAQLASQISSATQGNGGDGMSNVQSMWNATPVVDDAPPPVPIQQVVDTGDVEVKRDEAVREIFQPTGGVSMDVEEKRQFVEEVLKGNGSDDDEDMSDSSSSDDDLQSAVIKKPTKTSKTTKAGRGRKRR